MRLVLGTFVLLIWTTYTATADSSSDIDSMDGPDVDEDIFKRARIPKFIGKRTYELPEEDALSSDSISADASDAERLNTLAFLLRNYHDNPLDLTYNDVDDSFTRQARYIPKLVGRSIQERKIDINPLGKRRSPLFVGRRRAPLFVGKRHISLVGRAPQDRAPKFVGKRGRPVLIGRRRESTNNPENPVYSYVMLRRSVPYNENILPFSKSDSARSLLALDNLSAADKMVLGRYIPWDAHAKINSALSSNSLQKRFVPPHFVGKRIHYSPNYNGSYDGPRLSDGATTIKRFEAPLFIGRRSPELLQESTFLDTQDSESQYNIRKRGSVLFGENGTP